jgi:hypothetical protein
MQQCYFVLLSFYIAVKYIKLHGNLTVRSLLYYATLCSIIYGLSVSAAFFVIISHTV